MWGRPGGGGGGGEPRNSFCHLCTDLNYTSLGVDKFEVLDNLVVFVSM